MINSLNRGIRIRLAGLVPYLQAMVLPGLRDTPSMVDLLLDGILPRDRFGRLVKIWLGICIDIHHIPKKDAPLMREDFKSKMTRGIIIQITPIPLTHHLTTLQIVYTTRWNIILITFKNRHTKIVGIFT